MTTAVRINREPLTIRTQPAASTRREPATAAAVANSVRRTILLKMRSFLSIASASFAIVTGLVAGPVAASAPPPGLLPPAVPLAMALSVAHPDG